ncbi:MAG TPA: ATP12 family protein [Patescibacteria group bacterium]|nr:ATP12 family protein [Patescibacteria group bacterium]
MKRFYTEVTHGPGAQGGFEVRLDGKAIKTPTRKILAAPTEALAAALVKEWADQKDDILPHTMPLTQILTTALDRVSNDRAALQSAVLAYLDTDLLCYRAAHPKAMVQEQSRLWDPWLAWFEESYGIELRTSDHLRAHKQVPEAHKAAENAVVALDNVRFTLLQLIVSLSGSLVLGLAFVAGKIDAAKIFEAMHAEENFKAEVYNAQRHGFAPHEEKSRAEIQRDLEAAQFFLQAMG